MGEATGFDAEVAVARAGSHRRAFDAAWAEGTRLPLEEQWPTQRGAGVGEGRTETPQHRMGEPDPSEGEVVRLVAEGLRNADVADRLFISVATVKTHLARAFAKLGVASRGSWPASWARRSQET